MKLKVLAEANPTVGMGHFVRSLALAEMVRELVQVTFYFTDSSLAHSTLKERNFSYKKVMVLQDFISDLGKDDVVLLDGYDYDINFQNEVRRACYKVLMIDDKHDRPFSVDYLINHAPNIRSEEYEMEGSCTFLLGPEYALLRPAFFHVAKAAKNHPPEKVLICFGGADPKNLSATVAKIALSMNGWHEIKLVVGGGYGFMDTLEGLKKDSRLTICKNLNQREMAATIANTDLAIVPSSGILYECLALGVPALTGYYAENQSLMYKGWLNSGAIIGMGNFDKEQVQEKMRLILEGKIKIDVFIGKNPVDGKSPQRFQDVFKEILKEYDA